MSWCLALTLVNLLFAQNLSFAQKFGAHRDFPGRSVPKVDLAVNSTSSAPNIKSNNFLQDGSSPHPSVARIIVFVKGAYSFGSGSYVQNYGDYGIVVTNRHVIKDAVGLIQVHFPNGFTSYAAVLDSDEKWDLAILLISKSPDTPILQISRTTPKPNDPLWIAGYGSGKYRLAAGKCTNYITSESEFVDVSVDARQGDSGGPIFNQSGELAGVLFGSDSSHTAGSYCGRVRLFLEQSSKKLATIPRKPEQLFASIEPGAPKHTLSEGGKIFRNQILGGVIDSESASAKITTGGPQIGAKQANSAKPAEPNQPANVAAEPAKPLYGTAPVKVVSGNPNPTERRSVASHPASRVASNNRAATPPLELNRIHASDLRSPKSEANFTKAQLSDAQVRVAAKIKQNNAGSPGIVLQTTPQHDQSQMETTGFKQSESGQQFGAEYTESIDPVETSLSVLETPRSFADAIKLVVIVIVGFFIVFHLIKLMSIIEENEES